MRIAGTVSGYSVLMASIIVLFYWMCLESGSSSLQKRTDVTTVIETRSRISEQYPSANDLRQDDEVGVQTTRFA